MKGLGPFPPASYDGPDKDSFMSFEPLDSYQHAGYSLTGVTGEVGLATTPDTMGRRTRPQVGHENLIERNDEELVGFSWDISFDGV